MASSSLKRVGILTGGGDCPGLNAVIRAVAKPAMREYGATVIGIHDGFEGFVQGRMEELTDPRVSGIINHGGTILGTSNKGDPWHYPETDETGNVSIIDASEKVIEHYHQWELDALVAIGGDGTLSICHKLCQKGLNIVGVPKTIDNDVDATDLTFGFDSAVSTCTLAMDSLHTTASSHHRVMVCEVMGRYAGWIALTSGVAAGADIILLPEIPFTWEAVCRKVIDRSKHGKRFSIVCASEGALVPEVGQIVAEIDEKRTDSIKLGGIGEVVVKHIQEGTGIESRVTVLGHLQRGGAPTPFDRVLSTRFGALACKLAAEGHVDSMVALKGREVVAVPIAEAVAQQKLVPPDHQLIETARALGTSFGDR